MTQNKGKKMLKVGLLIFAIVCLVYGICFFLIPGTLVTISGADPVEFGWLRWAGGIIIALGIGALLVFRDPVKQGAFVTTAALANLLAGLGLLYSWLASEHSGANWFIGLPTILLLVISALLWWSKQKAKEIL